jgi:hypothetical protein
MDSTKSRERLREATKTIHGVEERRISIFTNTFHVKVHLLNSRHSRLFKVSIVGMESNGMTHEINSLGFKREVLENIFHRLLNQI